MNNYLKKLDEGSNLIIIKNRKTIFSSDKNGMFPLLEAIENVGLPKLANSIVVDKMVGKAAALIFCYFKAKKVYTKIISLKGKAVLEKFNIKYFSEKIIPDILNKTETDVCPFEKTVSDVNDPVEGYKKLKKCFEP